MKKKLKLFIVLFISSILLGAIFRLSPEFSEFYTLRISPIFRIPLSAVLSVFPFSIAESVVIILILFVLLAVLSGVKALIFKLLSRENKSYFKVYLKVVLYSLTVIYFSYVFIFEASYSRIPLKDTLGLVEYEMNSENVGKALGVINDELELLSEEIRYIDGQSTVSQMDFYQMADEVLESARRASRKYPVFQKLPFRAKPIAFSEGLAYTGISGIYSFFTGESNVNTAYSEYSTPFTMAHEYSHQMGIGSEKEAEFSALLICLESDSPYVRYSAYSQAAITLSNLLFELDEEAFYEVFSRFPKFLVADLYHSSVSAQKYSETYADEIAETINDTYLSLSGDEGVVSYSLSAQLYVSYFLRRK